MRNPLQSCLVFHSVLDLLQKPVFEQTLTHPITLFYHIWLKTASKGTRTGEKRVGAGREKSLSFTKITKEMNQ